LIIRQEKPSDFQNIYDLVKVAFQTAKVANGNEQDHVNKLRASGGYIPDLALVAEEDSKLVGHIMLTKTYITTGGSKFEALCWRLFLWLYPIVNVELVPNWLGKVLN